MEMDCYSFQSNVSPLDIQMLYDLPSYSKTISFPTINQDDIYMIWDCRFLRKLSVIIFFPMRLFGFHVNGKEAKKSERKEKKKTQRERKN